tara:strand:+ start:3556 stop:5250 length:1695 start_codon:yes stop_codon:yes gene_type:complete
MDVPRKAAPNGFHYMPDGTLMADADMLSGASSKKVISGINLDLSPLKASTSARSFGITGDDGAVFNLEVKNGDSNYYNFLTNVFQVNKTGLYNETIIGGSFNYNITFPTVEDNDQYDFYLLADPVTTRHTNYAQVNFGDGSVDINSSRGSNSLLMTKVIYQYLDKTLTISPYSAGGTIEVSSSVSDTIVLPRGSSAAKQPFSIACSVATAAKCYRIIKQPVNNDVISFVEPVVGSAPIAIEGENIYPAVTVAANSTSEGGTTVNGASTGQTVTTHVNAATIATVGDRVLGNAALEAAIVTVETVSGAKTFTISESISIADDLPLSFSNQMNYQWPINDFAHTLKEGMILVPGTGVTADSSVSIYQDTVKVLENTKQEKTIIKKEVPAVSTLAKKPVITKGEISTQEGAVVFDKQQVLAFAGNTLKVGGYGENEIFRLYGYNVVFSDLAIALTPITTTTTAASADGSSASVVVASRNGILDDVSTVSGIGINPKLANPTVDSGAGAVTGEGTIVLDAVQSLESGVTLTFAGAGQTATITGNIQVLKSGPANQTLRFDVDKLLSIT